MSEYQGRARFRFIGRPGGVLMRGAPDNYENEKIYENLPYKYKNMPYWELVDPPPVLTVPVASVDDSVFENQVFVPPELDDEPMEAMITKAEKVEEVTTVPYSLINEHKGEERVTTVHYNPKTGDTTVRKNIPLSVAIAENPLKDVPEDEEELISKPIHIETDDAGNSFWVEGEPEVPSGQPSSASSVKPMEPLAVSVNTSGANPNVPDYQVLYEQEKGVMGRRTHIVNPPEPASGDGAKEPINNPVSALIDSVKAKKVKGPGDDGYVRPLDIGGGFIPIPAKKEEPFKEVPVKDDEDMPAELRYELENMGDGILGENGVVKIERKKKVKE